MPSHADKHRGHDAESHHKTFDPYMEWFGIPPGQRTFYTLLGIDPGERDPERIRDAALSRAQELAQHLDGPHGAEAHKIDHQLSDAETCLLDPKKRAAYDRKILESHPELLVSNGTQATHDAIAEQIPVAISRTHRRTTAAPVLTRMADSIKRNPWVAAAAAGVVAGSAALFTIMRPRDDATPSALPAAAQQTDSATSAPTSTQVSPTPLRNDPLITPAFNPSDQSVPEPAPVPNPPPAAESPSLLPAVPPAPAAPAAAESKEPAPIVPESSPERISLRKAQPSPEDLQKFDDLAESSTLRKMTIEQLTEKARHATDGAEQWALFQLALSRARSEGKLKSAMEILQEKQRIFEGDDSILQEKIQTVRAAASSGAADNTEFLPALYVVMTELCDRAAFAEARKFLFELQRKPGIDRRRMTDIARAIGQLQSDYANQEIAEHQKTLQESPGDPVASRAAGMYRCFILGDWSATALLRDSGDAKLRALADRVERRAAMPAVERLTLARELLAMQSPPRVGAVAMAIECCTQMEPKPTSPVEAARLQDLLAELTQRYGAVLPLAQRNSGTAALQQQEEGQRLLSAASLPHGTIDLLQGTPDECRARMHIAKQQWKIENRNERLALVGSSPSCGWCAWLNLELPQEAKDLVRSGKYCVQVTFKLRPLAPPPGGIPPNAGLDYIPGTIGIGIPLPNGGMLPYLIDANAHLALRNAGLYRAGYHPKSITDFYMQQPPAWCADYQRMLFPLGEKGPGGQEVTYVIRSIVRTNPQTIDITTMAAGMKEKAPRIVQRFIAQPTIEGHPFIMTGDRGEGAPKAPSVGIGVAGHELEVTSMSISPPPRSVLPR